MTDQLLTNLSSKLANIAKNDLLKAILPVLDQFLTNIQGNQAGVVGDIADVNALKGNLIAALPAAGASGLKDAAGAAQTALDAAGAQAEATPVNTGA